MGSNLYDYNQEKLPSCPCDSCALQPEGKPEGCMIWSCDCSCSRATTWAFKYWGRLNLKYGPQYNKRIKRNKFVYKV